MHTHMVLVCISLIQCIKELDSSSDDLILLLLYGNCCNAIIILKSIICILAVIAAFNDKESGRIGYHIIETLLFKSTWIS